MTEYVNGAWGPYLSMLEGDGIHIRPWDAWPRDLDAITLYPQGGSVYAMQMPNGKYMSATNGGGSTITCDAVSIGPNEKFTFQWIPGNDSYLIWCPDGVHGLDAPGCVGQYLTAYYAPGGWSGQFCFHKFDEWGENKYSVWAYCSDGIGPGIFWPELSRPDGLPTYQQVIPPEVVDVFEYILCDDLTYSKPTSFTQDGGPVHTYWRYYNANGDIDIFVVRWSNPWNIEYTKYIASEQLIRFMYDCEDTQPNVDCGEACRFSMRESDTHKPSVWMKRYWTVGEVIDCSNSEGTSWHNDKTPCYAWSGPGYRSQLVRKFSEDFGGLVGVRDAIETHFIHLDVDNVEVSREVTVYAKGWGFVRWNVLIDGVLQYPEQHNIWSSTAPKVLPDFASICPETYVPQVPDGNIGDDNIGDGKMEIFVITADNVNTWTVPTGWNNINIIRNLNQIKKDYAHGWDATNKRYVAKTAGKYLIIGNVQWTGLDSGSSYASIIKNGNSVTNIGIVAPNAYSLGPSVIGIVDLNIGDYVQLSVCQNSGHNMYVTQWENVSFQGFLL